ncbi:glycosyltransferase [bacterium]
MNRRPGVAHILVPYIQKTETFIYDRLTHHRRYDPFVFTDEPPINTDLLPFSPIYSLPAMPAFVRRANAALKQLTGLSPFFYRQIKSKKPAVVHAHYGPVGAAAMPAVKAARKPLVVSFYGIDASAFLDDEKHAASYRKMFQRAEIISVLSADMADRLAEAGCPREKLRVHHLALDMSKYIPAPPSSGSALRIVSVGRFVPKKGYSHLLSSFKIMQNEFPESELHLYGSGPLEDAMKKLAVEQQLEKNVVFHGHQPREVVMKAISEAHIFALFSVTGPDGDREGTPTVLIEAGAMGVPSVSTLHAGIPEVVADGESGLLVKEGDEEAFADRLLRLARDAELRESMGTAARSRIEREFDIHSVMEQIEKTYDELA